VGDQPNVRHPLTQLVALCILTPSSEINSYTLKMSSGLPYEGTPPPSTEATMTVPSALDRPLGDYEEPSALDRPLEEYNPTRVVPEHVQSLMGRMSKGKVYLLEESPAVILMDDGERLRRDPVSD
jgi:hypothetical protein